LKILIILLISFLGLYISPLPAQVLRTSVEVDYQHLSSDEQQYLKDFKGAVEDYFNNYAWTEDEYETDVTVSIYIIIETVRQKSFEKIYKAQFQIKSISGESFYDKEWEFPYQPSSVMEHNKMQFDPLTNFFDYYAALILAGELDTYGELLGTPYYNNAQDIANRGILSQYPRGWNNRLIELQKITHSYTLPLRQTKPNFFEAEYLVKQGKLKEARAYGQKVMTAIEEVISQQPNNKYLKMFFDAHYVTFAEIFRGDLETLDLLTRYDSPHRDTYQEMMNQ
jgi:hypothetical protein